MTRKENHTLRHRSHPQRGEEGRAWSGNLSLSSAETHRYLRQLVLPEVGLEGQQKLKRARVLCVGVGGLGSASTLYLAAAGVGHLTLVDDDTVVAVNLPHQVLYSASEVGRLKVEVARERLQAQNPYVSVTALAARFTPDNAQDLVRTHDVVIDGSDNFPTRYLANDACVQAGKPYVFGSVFRHDGQVSVFHPQAGGPCYRCLFPDPPPPGAVPTCTEGGVLGMLPGVIGCLQAVECVKVILGKGAPLIGRVLLFDALEMEFHALRLHRNPKCPCCGKQSHVSAEQ